jgi:hypothetical protein
MTETMQLGLPLLQPSQAQKHVTVNEALSRLDGLVHLGLQSRSQINPPSVAEDGMAFSVPGGGTNAWSGNAGRIAIYSNGGWVFVQPKRGWRAFVQDESVWVVHDGTIWRSDLLSLSPNGAATLLKIREFDHPVGAGATSTTVTEIPAGAMVIGVTGRVIEDITGGATSWQLGTSDGLDRFGSGLGLSQGSYLRGILSAPMTYWELTPLILSAQGGDFTGGTVRLAIHYIELGIPGI